MPVSAEEGTVPASQIGEALPAQAHLPTRSEIRAQFMTGANAAVSTPTTAEVLDMVVNIEGGPRFPRFPLPAALAAHSTANTNSNTNANASLALATANARVEQSTVIEQSAVLDPLANLRGGGGGLSISLAAHEVCICSLSVLSCNSTCYSFLYTFVPSIVCTIYCCCLYSILRIS